MTNTRKDYCKWGEDAPISNFRVFSPVLLASFLSSTQRSHRFSSKVDADLTISILFKVAVSLHYSQSPQSRRIMPRYYCDYCDTYLTHDSPSVRKQHNAGYKHKANVRSYYQQYEAQLNQSLIDQKVKEHLGAYRPVGPPYPLRPGLPILPTPQMPMHLPVPVPGTAPVPGSAPLVPGIRPPPMLPRPVPGAPGYSMSQMVTPPAAPLPGQLNGIPRPLTAPPPVVPSSAGMPVSSGAPRMFTPVYQGNMAVPTTGSGESSDMNAQAAEANH